MITYLQVEKMGESAPSSIIGVENNGIIKYVNPTFTQFLKFEKVHLIGKNLSFIVPDTTINTSFLEKFKNDTFLHNEEIELNDSKDAKFSLLVSSTKCDNDNGGSFTYFFMKDITEIRKKEKLLQYLHKIGTALHSASDADETIDMITRIIVPDFADLFSIDLLNKNKIINIKLEHQNSDFIEWVKNYKKENETLENEESPISFVLKNGKPFTREIITNESLNYIIKGEENLKIAKKLNLQSTMIVPIIVNKQTIGAVSFASTKVGKHFNNTDIAFSQSIANHIGCSLNSSILLKELGKKSKLLKEARQKKDEFINIASHELKTPLTTSRASLQLAERIYQTEANSEKIQPLLAKAAESLEKLSLMIDDLLQVSRLEKQEQKLNKTACKIADMINSCCDAIIKEGKYKITLTGDTKVEVYADKQKITDVITHLVHNAIKHAPFSFIIIIKTEVLEDFVKISVEDSGPGISDDKLETLFKSYYQVQDESTIYSGIGLGLYFSEKIITSHDGKIGVDTILGKGSTFWFTLPLAN